ncbi:MAG: M48 family metalloprotease [Alphaproteobacteria bacterium]|nr:M48 family metalloprotease [Alphaproteobacteria bacterium]
MCQSHASNDAAPKLVDVSKMPRRDVVRALAGGSLVLVAPACAPNPVTGRSQLILVDEAQLNQMALQAWAQERQQNRVWNNAAQQARLERVGRRIAQATGRTDLQWEFVVFDRQEANAYVLPGGKVGFYRGIMELAETDDQLATVMGHEAGHVTGRHAAERYSREVAQNAALQAAGAAINSQVAMAALGLGAQVGLSLPFSRAQESEADIIGLNYMHSANYDVRQAITFWGRMAQQGGNRPPQFLSTHPDPASRIGEMRAYINQRGWGPV